jgi:biopolymer transport protein ExbD
MFNLQENTKPRAHLDGNMLPVISMTFLLLLFFLVVGTFSENFNQEILPPRSASEIFTESAAVELELTRNGALLWQGKNTSVPAWAESLRSEGLAIPARVRLRADGATPASVFIPVLEDLKYLQISRVALITVNNDNPL